MEASRINILLREYDALYALVTFRMASLDRRIPLIGATLTAFLSSLVVLPAPAQAVLLLEVPAVLIWFLRTTATHACSFEDVLRRIEEIELSVNALAGVTLLQFQSRHPSRRKRVGGRTGAETVMSTFFASLLMLAACAYLACAAAAFGPVGLRAYALYLAVIAGVLVRVVVEWRRYRYAKPLQLPGSCQ